MSYQQKDQISTISPDNFLVTVEGNVDNPNLTDADFRDLIRRTLPIVKFKGNDRAEYGD